MPPKRNPLNLNPLQLRTLTLLQVIARIPGAAAQAPNGEVTIAQFPSARGDDFHLSRRDSRGQGRQRPLYNEKLSGMRLREGSRQGGMAASDDADARGHRSSTAKPRTFCIAETTKSAGAGSLALRLQEPDDPLVDFRPGADSDARWSAFGMTAPVRPGMRLAASSRVPAARRAFPFRRSAAESARGSRSTHAC